MIPLRRVSIVVRDPGFGFFYFFNDQWYTRERMVGSSSSFGLSSSSSSGRSSSSSERSSPSSSSSERSPWTIDDEKFDDLFREWTRLKRGTCRREFYPKRRRKETVAEYLTRVVETLRYHAKSFQEIHACLAAHVARDRNVPKRARAFAKEGLQDMEKRMRDVEKDELLKAYRKAVENHGLDLRRRVPPMLAHRKFMERKAKLVERVRKIRIWDRRAYSNERLARKIVEHSKYDLALSASAALEGKSVLEDAKRKSLPENAKRLVMNLANVSYPVRVPSTSPPSSASNDDGVQNAYADGAQNGYVDSLPKPLAISFVEIQRERQREFRARMNAENYRPFESTREPTLERKLDVFRFVESAYFGRALTKYSLDTFPNARELVQYVRKHEFPRDPTWRRLRKFALDVDGT